MAIRYFGLIALFVLFFLTGCVKPIEVPVPEIEKLPVVNCLFSPDSLFRLRLTETSGLNDSLFGVIEGAECILSQDNRVIDTFDYVGNGFYLSRIFPEIGKMYTLEVQTPDGHRLAGFSYIPQGVDIIKVEQQDFAVADNNPDLDGDLILPFNRVSITFHDKAGEENYYEVRLLVKRFWEDSLSNQFLSVPLFSYDNSIKAEDILDYSPAVLPFSDSLFDGQTKTLDVLYHLPWWEMYQENGHNVYTYGKYRIFLIFREISKQFYLYRKSLIKHLYNQQTDSYEILGDPVQLFTNIAGGYGIFAGYVQYIDTIFVSGSSITY